MKKTAIMKTGVMRPGQKGAKKGLVNSGYKGMRGPIKKAGLLKSGTGSVKSNMMRQMNKLKLS